MIEEIQIPDGKVYYTGFNVQEVALFLNPVCFSYKMGEDRPLLTIPQGEKKLVVHPGMTLTRTNNNLSVSFVR